MDSMQQGPTVSNVPGKPANRKPNFQPMPTTATAPPQQANAKLDPFYGHEVTARLCARFITHLFACPEYPPTSTQTQARLPYFIAYALHRTKLHPSVTFAALVLLQRLKARFPTARGSSGHRLFISAFMIASKVICDDTYSNKSWSIVAQGMFTLREINQMEREMCNYLDWELTVDNPILSNFEMMVKRDFAADRSSVDEYPTYSLQTVSKRAARAAASDLATPLPDPYDTTSPIPAFNPNKPPSIKTSGSPMKMRSYPNSPMTPDTPSPSYSNSTSPASSASPATPMSVDEYNPKIQIHGSPRFSLSDAKPSALHPLKPKMYAYAGTAAW